MNKKELINRCLINKDAIVTYPFMDKKYDDTPVLRHKSNNKWFGLIFEMNNNLCINLKAPPDTICILKEQYPNIIKTAWHMNKTHWCTVLANKIEVDVLDAIIKLSFDVTAPKKLNKK